MSIFDDHTGDILDGLRKPGWELPDYNPDGSANPNGDAAYWRARAEAAELKLAERESVWSGVVMELRARAMVAEQESARLREEARWIPVTERLPEVEYNEDGESVPVQGFCNAGIWDGVLAPIHYVYRTGHWYFGQSYLDTVTHWRNMPEPPAGETE